MIFKFLFLDSPYPWQLGFQDPATPLIIGIIHFYNYLIFFLVAIGLFVLWILARALILFKNSQESTTYQKVSTFCHSTPLEIVWTVVPAFLLVLIAGPSFALLYSFEESIAPDISIKVIGHQWFWSYEYSDVYHRGREKTVSFDSYIIAEEDLSFGQFRLLETDNRLRLPTKRHIRVLVSAADVLHSWAVPSLGIKIDACPGRLNQVSLYLLRSGTFYGQCSELCGVNHAFIPIVVEALDFKNYLNWTSYFGLSTSEKLALVDQEKDLSREQVMRRFDVLYQKHYRYLYYNCRHYPKNPDYRINRLTARDREQVLNLECSKARAFLAFVKNPNYELILGRDIYCREFYDNVFRKSKLFKDAKPGITCEKMLTDHGADTIYLQVLDNEVKAYYYAKKLVDQANSEFYAIDEKHLSARKKILEEN